MKKDYFHKFIKIEPYIHEGLSLVSSSIFIIIINNFFGAEVFGIYNFYILITSLVSSFLFFNNNATLINFLQRDYEKAKIFTAMCFSLAFFSILNVIVFIFFKELVSSFFENYSIINIVLIDSIILILIKNYLKLLDSYLIYKSDSKTIFRLKSLKSILRLISLCVIIFNGLDFLIYIFKFEIISNIFPIILYSKKLKSFSFKLNFDFNFFKKYFSHVTNIHLSGIIENSKVHLIETLIVKVESPYIYGIYKSLKKIANGLDIFYTPNAKIYYKKISNLVIDRNPKAILIILKKEIKKTLLLIVIPISFLLIFSRLLFEILNIELSVYSSMILVLLLVIKIQLSISWWKKPFLAEYRSSLRLRLSIYEAIFLMLLLLIFYSFLNLKIILLIEFISALIFTIIVFRELINFKKV